MRILAVGLGALALGAPSLGCGSSKHGAPGAATTVRTFDFGFAPAQLTLKTGQSVTWTNTGRQTHTVKGPGFFSRTIDPGRSYTFRFSKPGSSPYLCTLHPTLMRGTIVVQA